MQASERCATLESRLLGRRRGGRSSGRGSHARNNTRSISPRLADLPLCSLCPIPFRKPSPSHRHCSLRYQVRRDRRRDSKRRNLSIVITRSPSLTRTTPRILIQTRPPHGPNIIFIHVDTASRYNASQVDASSRSLELSRIQCFAILEQAAQHEGKGSSQQEGRQACSSHRKEPQAAC